MKMPGSSGMWGLSIPPAMLKPRPELPCGKPQAAAVPCGHFLAGSAVLTAASPPLTASPLLREGSGCVAEGRPVLVSPGCWALSTQQMERERGSRQDLPRRHVSAERLRQAARGGTRGWSLAEKTSPRWRHPRRRHRRHSPCGETGLGPTTSICPPRPPRLRVLQCCAGSRHCETSGSLVSPVVLVCQTLHQGSGGGCRDGDEA